MSNGQIEYGVTSEMNSNTLPAVNKHSIAPHWPAGPFFSRQPLDFNSCSKAKTAGSGGGIGSAASSSGLRRRTIESLKSGSTF